MADQDKEKAGGMPGPTGGAGREVVCACDKVGGGPGQVPQSVQGYREPDSALASASAAAPGTGRPDYRPKLVASQPLTKPAIISYVKPGMDLYVAEQPPPAAPVGGKTARTTCTCDLVCTCEAVSMCGCNLVRVRNPVDVRAICTCDTVPVCTCNMATVCTCNKVATRVCSCDLICTCDTVCTCNPQCSCQTTGGGGFGRSVCRCVPVIH